MKKKDCIAFCMCYISPHKKPNIRYPVTDKSSKGKE